MMDFDVVLNAAGEVLVAIDQVEVRNPVAAAVAGVPPSLSISFAEGAPLVLGVISDDLAAELAARKTVLVVFGCSPDLAPGAGEVVEHDVPLTINR